MRTRYLRKLDRTPLFWQIFLPNAVLLGIVGAVLAFSPAAIGSEISLTESVEIGIGLVAVLLVNLWLIRRAVRPVEELTETMSAIDALEPGQRAVIAGGSAETARMASVFNAMLGRLEADRRGRGASLLSAQERERVRLARELHDEIGQSLTGLMLALDRAAGGADPEVEAQLREAQEATRRIGGEVREIVRRLRPEALDDLGLKSALVALTERFSETTRIPVERNLSADLPALDPEEDLVIYRVAQEGLTNVSRHAGANRVEVSLTSNGDRAVRLRVRDDGVGVSQVVPGSGIQGMHERAMLIGGDLSISTQPGEGVEVLLTVPVEDPR